MATTKKGTRKVKTSAELKADIAKLQASIAILEKRA